MNRKQLIASAFDDARGAWRGCDWTTAFGKQRLDLRSLRSQQTRILAEATCGEESQTWESATRWLLEVERDAREAEVAAEESIRFVHRDEIISALDRVNDAIALESKYRESITWLPLFRLISEFFQFTLISGTNEHEHASNTDRY